MAIDDSYTKAMLHFDGANGSTTFTDESGKTWTASGNAQISTAQSVFGGASGQFDGTGDYITTPDSADWQLDSGSNANEWTIDFRIRFNGDPGTAAVGFMQQYVDANNRCNIRLDGNALYFAVRSGGTIIVNVSNAWNPATATWYHLAIVKQGTTGYKMFVDGSQIGTTQTDTDVIPSWTGTFQVGRYSSDGSTHGYLNGWIDELRISKGIARWINNFTPPAYPYNPSGGYWYE